MVDTQTLHEVRTVPIDALRPHPQNANQGDVEGIGESLDEFGLYRSVAYQKSTGYLVAGNHTWQAAKRRGWTHILAAELDVDDDTAKRILAGDNRWRDRATYNPNALAELLTSISDLTGTGYDSDDIASLTALIEPPDLEELASTLTPPQSSDTWPTVSVKVPRHVASAWRSHVDTFSGSEADAFASLLGVDLDDGELPPPFETGPR